MLYINGRQAVHRACGGYVKTISVNLTGALHIPIPYPNLALAKDAMNTCRNLCCNGQPLCHIKSYFSKSLGDEAGSFGGIVSGTVNGRAEFITGSHNVTVTNGAFTLPKSLVRAGDLMVSNNRNTAPAPLQLESTKTQSTVQAQFLAAANKTADWICDIDVNNQPPHVLSGYLVIHNAKQVYLQQPIMQFSQSGQRLNRCNLTVDAPYPAKISLALADEEFGSLKIPLITAAQFRHRTQVAPALDQANLILIAVNLRQQTNPHPNQVASRSYSRDDIYRLPMCLREHVHKQLAALSVKPISWFKALTPALQRLIQKAFAPSQNQCLRPGWLYVFRDGFLWRELHVLPDAQYRDVNLAHYMGNDQRPAHGEQLEALLVVLRQPNKMSHWQLAYSEAQWSWSKVNEYGGINPNDPRIIELRKPIALVKPTSRKTSRRAKRFTELNLSAYWQQESVPPLYYAKRSGQVILCLADPLVPWRAALHDSVQLQDPQIEKDMRQLRTASLPPSLSTLLQESL